MSAISTSLAVSTPAGRASTRSLARLSATPESGPREGSARRVASRQRRRRRGPRRRSGTRAWRRPARRRMSTPSSRSARCASRSERPCAAQAARTRSSIMSAVVQPAIESSGSWNRAEGSRHLRRVGPTVAKTSSSNSLGPSRSGKGVRRRRMRARTQRPPGTRMRLHAHRREPLDQQLGDASFLGLAPCCDPSPPGGIGRPCAAAWVVEAHQTEAPRSREAPGRSVRPSVGLTSCRGMPPPPPCGGWSCFSSGFSATIASVVSSSAATLAAFWSAERTTLVGSMTPALIRSSYSSVAALKPKRALAVLAPCRRRSSPRRRRSPRSGAAAPRARGGRCRRPRACSVVELPSSAVERRLRAEQRDAAAGHDALFDRRARRVQRVLDARLLLLHLGLGRRADLDHRDAAGELREALLELLAVVVGGGLLDLRADLGACGPRSPSSPRAVDRSWCCPCRSRRFLARPRSLSVTFSSLRPSSSAITWPPVRIAMSSSIALRRSPKPGAFTAAHVQRAAELVHDERRERLALDVLGDDQQRLAAGARSARARGSRSFMFEIFFSCIRISGVLEHDLHALRGRSRSRARGSRGRTACPRPRRASVSSPWPPRP